MRNDLRNRIHVLTCSRNSLIETTRSVSHSWRQGFALHIWAGVRAGDHLLDCGGFSACMHTLDETGSPPGPYTGFEAYKTIMREAASDDIAVIMEDDVDVHPDWLRVALPALRQCGPDAVLSMHHFYDSKHTALLLPTGMSSGPCGIMKAHQNMGATGTQAMVATGNTWSKILDKIDSTENIRPLQDMAILKVWRDKYFVLDPCVVKHRVSVPSTWRGHGHLATHRCIF